MNKSSAIVLLILMFFLACRVESGLPASKKQASDAKRPQVGATIPSGDKPMTISLTSSAFSDGERIPKMYTGEGQDVSPPLAWSGLPEGTKELAIICEDPDAPTAEPWVHWVIYKIPANIESLPEGLPQPARLKNPPGAFQGLNSWASHSKPTYGYRGPFPPIGHGTHHYYFTICALDTKLIIEPGVSKKVLVDEIQDHILDTGVLTGLYSR
jgi:Raf kinase inhibitor-like YbhB/YbcL family protein